ncbi:MAG: helix-turn-helix transcriptional regulator [Hyphomicrobiales bacterium]
MARGDQLARQWVIFQNLCNSRRGKTVNELSGDLDCHPRTVYRDLDALQAAGFPLVTERQNGTTRWALMEGARRESTMPFAMSELMALHFSRRMIDGLQGTLFQEALDSAFRKIRSTLPPESLRFLSRVGESLGVATGPHKSYGPFRETIGELAEAAMNKQAVEILYRSLSSGNTTRRKVEPYKLWFFDGSFYLIGLCRLKNEVRIFAVDRIQEIEVLDEIFAVPCRFDAESFMRNSFGIFAGKPVLVRVWFAPEAAGYVREKTWHPSQRLYERTDGSLLFEAEVAGTREIKLWVLRFGAGARVLEPDSLREEIRLEAAEMLMLYSDHVPHAEVPLTGQASIPN